MTTPGETWNKLQQSNDVSMQPSDSPESAATKSRPYRPRLSGWPQ
jgi:hypothetical protein